MKLNLPNECSNSPKQRLIQELFLSFAKRDYAAIIDYITNDVIWEIVGERMMTGKEDVHAFFEAYGTEPIEEIVLDYILTHGKFGAVGGKIIMATHIVYFAEFYDFATAGSKKIRKIKSFVIQEPKPAY
ncbi:MAG TPA: nuclear transport factor 2 family protein [Sphingobacterium sp.]|nr:nuclear transport factor 2 family protein [Sphingobacterium sp.]